MNDLKEEIIRRFSSDKTNYEAIGAEIKRHRLAMSKTLQHIADKDCSVSYLCKIERNQVKPSIKYLEEICKKVNITKDNIEYLLSSKNLLLESIKLFYFKDSKAKEKYKESLEGLENYRTELIRLIFNLIDNDFNAAGANISKIWNLISSLNDFDLMVFAGFFGIYKYYIKDYVEGAEYLKLALEFNNEVLYFRPIIYKYLFMICFQIGSKSIYNYYKLLEQERIKYGENLDLDEIYYHLALFYIEEKNEKAYKETKIKVCNKIYSYNLDILYSLSKGHKIKEIDLISLNDYTKIAYLINTSDENLLETINSSNIDIDSQIYFKYLYLKKHDLEQAYNFLMDIAYPYAVLKDIYHRARYFLNEMIYSIHRPNKYKKFFDMYIELDKTYEAIKNI